MGTVYLYIYTMIICFFGWRWHELGALFSIYWNGSIYLSSLWRGKQSSDRYITLTERFWVTRHRSIPETVLSTCYLYILGPSGDRRPDGHPLSHLHPDILFYHHLSNPFTSFPASTSTTTIPPAELTAAFVPARFSSVSQLCLSLCGVLFLKIL